MIRITKRRSLVKALIYRTLISILGFIIVGLVGDLTTAVKTSLIIIPSTFITYYFYERLWAKIDYGRKANDKYLSDKKHSKG